MNPWTVTAIHSMSLWRCPAYQLPVVLHESPAAYFPATHLTHNPKTNGWAEEWEASGCPCLKCGCGVTAQILKEPVGSVLSLLRPAEMRSPE
ncbi:unnamed protein product [Staurois parvus]|uniref:Uncharacterized protein n=1 Tax=Staurois parvus TaxID=386267 RepID=A0ABN9CUB2_9NEOB|nr:unnamed protein product [Staurois parvus]